MFVKLLVPATLLFVGMQLDAKSVLEGAYTEAQAARGQAAYEGSCARCHAQDMQGGINLAPALVTDKFIDEYRDDDLTTLFQFLKVQMPPGRSAKDISDQTYVDIVSYILSMHKYPAGSDELTPANLATTQFVGHDGPKPLPTNATVLTIGCLGPGTGDSLTLASAMEPVRTKVPDATTPEELKASAAKPLGKESFRLTNLDDIKGDPSTLKGHKVQVKGALIRAANGGRINVLSLEDIGATCP